MEEYFMMDQYRGGNGALRTTMAVTSFGSSRRKKSVEEDDGDLDVNLPGNSSSPAISATTVRGPSSTSKSSGARRKSREVVSDNMWRSSLDLQEENFVTDNSDYYIHCGFSRETTPTSEHHRGDTEAEMEPPSTAKKKSREVNRRGGKAPAAGNKPPTAEIEEFFAVAEKYDQKRFQEKYNYDIVKDVPLEGRYQWVRLKP